MVIGLGQYLAFVGVSLLVICTPGQDTALTIRNTLLGDRRTGAATALGVSAGQATWTVATSAGLAVILTASALKLRNEKWESVCAGSACI